MPRAVVLCSTIVAAFQLQTAAIAAPIDRVPVTPAIAALVERTGLDLHRDQPRLLPELIRVVYSPPNSKPPALASQGAPISDAITVDVPLSRQVWADAIFHRPIAIDQLLQVILGDKRAALLCRGLTGADDETLEYYSSHPTLLSLLYERSASSFAAFGASIQIHDGRIVVPGGESAQALWEGVLHASAATPDAFIKALFQEPEPRGAYLYDVLAAASPEARAFALGLWIPDQSIRLQRFQALALAVRTAFHEWHADELPFARPLNDLAILLLRIRVGPDGTPLEPSERQFWSVALGVSASEGPAAAAAAGQTKIDAAWLIQATSGDMYVRGDKLDQLSFGQRAFGMRAEAGSEAVAQIVRELPSRRMLLLGLERLGIAKPEIYAASLQIARSAQDGGGERFWTETQLQGALALLLRMHDNGTIDDAGAEALVRSLLAVPLSNGEYRGELGAWIETVLAPRLPGGETMEGRLIAGLAGGPTPGDPHVEWEGQSYRLDLAHAERLRIQEIRKRQGGMDVDLALQVASLGRRVSRAESGQSATALGASIRAFVTQGGAKLARAPSTLFAPGVPVPREPRDWLLRAADDLERAARGGDTRRIARTADSLLNLADVTIGEALVTLVYATHLGDPDGPALLGANVALRHDFGFGRRDGDARSRLPWSLPRQDFQPGVPWHVVGSLLGLEIGLAPLRLRRLSMDSLDAPPRLPSIERDGFAVNVSLLNPRRLTDGDRDRIVNAIAIGRNRVHQLKSDPGRLDRLADEMSLDGWRRRSLGWVLRNEPDSIENLFSLAELAALGGHEAAIDAWGPNAILSFGCVCTHFPEPRLWRVLGGRTQMAMMSASSAEMNLELAQRLSALRLPAALLPSILSTAMQVFVDNVTPVDASDVASLVRYVRGIPDASFTDFVAAAATLDGPLVPLDDADSAQP